MKTHLLKTWPKYFGKIIDGSKTFEYRKNDRHFKPGDIVILLEWDYFHDDYIGRNTARKIGYIFEKTPGVEMALRLPKGYCIFSLLPLEETERN